MTEYERYPEIEPDGFHGRERLIESLDVYMELLTDRYQSLRQSIEIGRGDDVLLVDYTDYASILQKVLRYGELYYRRLAAAEQESTND